MVFLVFVWLIAETRANIEVIRGLPRATCATPFQAFPIPRLSFLVVLVVPIVFGGFLSGLVGIWSVPEQVVVVTPLPPPDPPAKPDVVDDEFAALERELEEIE